MSWFHISWIVVCLTGINVLATMGVVFINWFDARMPNDPAKLGPWIAKRIATH